MCQRGSLTELTDNENTIYQDLWNVATVMLRVKCIALNAYIKKEDKSQANNLSSLKKQEKEDKNYSKASKMEIVMIKKLKTEKLIKNINENFLQRPIKLINLQQD